MSIEVGTSLIPGTANTPLDARCRVTEISDIPNIANPFLGMEIFCIANGKTYKVISLKSKMIGSMSVANGAVDEYEEIPDAAALAALEKRVENLENADPEGGSGGTAGEGNGTNNTPESVTATISTLMLTKPENGLFLIIRKAGSDGTRANSTVIIDTLNNPADRLKVKGYLDSGTDGSWTVCPEDGFSSPYDGAGISVDLSSLTDLPCTLFYCWATDAETMSDWHSLEFPCCGGGGEIGKNTIAGNSGTTAVNALFCLCTEEPPTLFDGLIWIEGGTAEPQYIPAPGGINVITEDIGNYSNYADGTIILNLNT